MTIEQLKTYCSMDETRPGILEPWSLGDRTYATDGIILIWVPRIESVPEMENAPKNILEIIVDNPFGGAQVAIPKLPCPRFSTCGICVSGRVYIGGGKSVTCGECDGEFEWRRGISVKVGCQLISDIYLEKIKALPNYALFNSSKDKLCAAGFTFDGGSGLIMPMRKSSCEN